MIDAATAHAVAQAAQQTASDTMTFRTLTDGGLLLALLGIGKVIFDMGRLREMVAGHDERIQRIERARDAEQAAGNYGLRPRNPDAHD